MQLSVAQPARAQQAHERGQESMLQFQALRSGGFYMETVNAMMTRLTSSQIVAKLGLKPSTPEPLPPGDQLASADVKLAKLHWDFLMDLAANRCWSQSFHTILPPYHFTMVFLPPDSVGDAQGIWETTCRSLLRLERYCNDRPDDHYAKKLLADVGTLAWPIVREFWTVGRECPWNVSDESFQKLAYTCFAGPVTTKATLESAFNHVKDSTRQSRSNKMSPCTRYAYLACNPYARTGGINLVETTTSDFAKFGETPSLVRKVFETRPFDPKQAALPEQTPTRQKLKTTWRPAGFEANRKAAAAVAFSCMRLSNSDASAFSKINKAWLCSPVIELV